MRRMAAQLERRYMSRARFRSYTSTRSTHSTTRLGKWMMDEWVRE